jgi:hypothetical protein
MDILSILNESFYLIRFSVPTCIPHLAVFSTPLLFGTVTQLFCFCWTRMVGGYSQPYEEIGVNARAGKYPQPLSFVWRANHTIAYLIGGITFFFGSIQYLPWINNFELGGWLFTIGSTGNILKK